MISVAGFLIYIFLAELEILIYPQALSACEVTTTL